MFSIYDLLKVIAITILTIMAFNVNAESLIRFDIDKQRADKALLAFAKKTNQTIIFSYDLTKNYQANALKGYYSVSTGLKALLDNSGLIAHINESNQLSIQLDAKYKKSHSAQESLTKNTTKTATVAKKSQKTKARKEPQIEKISIVGSRTIGRYIDELPVPVDILSSEVLVNTGQTEVGRMLQTVTPSFNFPSSAISDGTDALLPATLRGLGPDQTLVLINGKRRHQASLLHINTSVGRGTTGTDMNAIPVAAIKHIEVLRDGASAQYGSDAIAGVINIILNDNNTVDKISSSYGEYSKGDGETILFDISKSFTLGNTGYVNTTLSYRDHGYTNRAGLHGSCQYSGCSKLANGIMLSGDPRETSAPRNTFRIGDADSDQLSLVINSAYELQVGELYGFATYSKRKNQSAAFFRHNSNHDGNALLLDGDATIPSGFLPKINSDIKDISLNFGYQTSLSNNANVDFSYTYGQNNIDYVTSDTINSSFANALQFKPDGSKTDISSKEIRNLIPRQAFAYGLELALSTLNFDYIQRFDLFSLAFGAEIRTDFYKVIPGDEYSFRDYDTINGKSLFTSDRAPGTQGFGGISFRSAVKEKRNVFSLYAESELDVTEALIINGALRYDNYEGFGGTTNVKLATNWSVSEEVAIRGAINTGFRAPSVQQLYFNNISTQFIIPANNTNNNNQIAMQVGTFRNDSALVKSIGIPELKEEESTNYSLGAVFQIDDDIKLTIDWYYIEITDRIVISNKLEPNLSTFFDETLKRYASDVDAAQIFLNGADTQTKGIDLIATWNTTLLTGDLQLTLAANYTQTDVVNLFTPSESGLGAIAADEIFSVQDISILEEWQPQDRVSANALYKLDDITINLTLNRYGEYTITDGGRQTYGAELLTDIRINYQFSNTLSFNIGVNNLFDTYPDTNKISNSNVGKIIDHQGNVIVDSQGVFTYSRRSAPFGFNGAYYYLGVEYLL